MVTVHLDARPQAEGPSDYTIGAVRGTPRPTADPSYVRDQARLPAPQPGYGSRMPDDADANLDDLAAAYGVDPPSVEAVANEVIKHATDTHSGAGHALEWGENEYGAVVDIILAVVETPGVVQALADGDKIPQGFVIEAEGRVWPDGRHQTMPALAMVELVIADIRHAFGSDGD